MNNNKQHNFPVTQQHIEAAYKRYNAHQHGDDYVHGCACPVSLAAQQHFNEQVQVNRVQMCTPTNYYRLSPETAHWVYAYDHACALGTNAQLPKPFTATVYEVNQ